MTENVRLNVLVIESDPDVRDVFTALLEVWGCSVVSVAKYDQANEGAANSTFDVVIMEFQHTYGPDMCFRLHQSPNTRDALLITTITYDDGGLTAKAEISGIKHILTKPLDLDVLLDLLKAAKARRRT